MTTLAHENMRYIANNWESYFSSAVLSGIVGDPAHQAKGGYHISIEDNSPSNYSVVRVDDKAPPGTWPRNLAAGIDMSMSGPDMKLCCDRLWSVWNDKSDPRRNYMNAFNGWFNNTSEPAKRYDFVTGPPGGISETTSDHKWHTHLEIRRKWVTDRYAANAILSVLRGESKEQWAQNSTTATGEEDMYASKGMGLNGSPISHNTMYLQEMMLVLRPDAATSDHPLTTDGKYGSNTAWWVSIILTGGSGEEVNGYWFAMLAQFVAAKLANAEVAGHLTNTPHVAGTMPTHAQFKISEQTVTAELLP